MKLKTKLIPLTGLALMGTTVVPLTLTSCGNNSIIGSAFNLTHYYYPIIERHTTDVLPLDEIKKIYIEKLEEDNTVFVQDYMWSKSWLGTSFNQYALWETLLPSHPVHEDFHCTSAHDLYEYDNESISHLSMHLQDNDKGEQEMTLSFTLKFNGQILSNILEQTYLQGDTTGYVYGYASGEINFNNVPFTLRKRDIYYKEYTTPIEVLSFEPDVSFIRSGLTEDWSINFYIACSISGEIQYNTGLTERIANDLIFAEKANIDNLFWTEYGFGFDKLTNLFSSSYYLQKVTPV